MENKQLNLYQRLNQVRKEIAEKGYIKKGGNNTFDNYKYFTEAQYKELMNTLFAKYGVELKSTIKSVEDTKKPSTNQSSTTKEDKLKYGVRISSYIELINIDNPTERESYIAYGDAFDRSDKAIYKALTGCIKYFFANNFLVATGDDPEKNEEQKEDKKKAVDKKENEEQKEKLIAEIAQKITPEDYQLILDSGKELKDYSLKALEILLAKVNAKIEKW